MPMLSSFYLNNMCHTRKTQKHSGKIIAQCVIKTDKHMHLYTFIGRVTFELWIVLESRVVGEPGHRSIVSKIIYYQKWIALLCNSIVEPWEWNRICRALLAIWPVIEKRTGSCFVINCGLATNLVHPIIFFDQLCWFICAKSRQELICIWHERRPYWKINGVKYDRWHVNYVSLLPKFRKERLIPITQQILNISDTESVEFMIYNTASSPKQIKSCHIACKGKCFITEHAFVRLF